MSHRTAPVEMREAFALGEDLTQKLLGTIHTEGVLEEALILDTCNRIELHCVARPETDIQSYFFDHIARLKGHSASVDASTVYRYDGLDAARHLFRVSAALDSQIIGEHQILGQVKNAYRLATHARTAHHLLNKVLHRALRVGKRTQTETALGRGAVSVAGAAVDLAGQIFSDLAGKVLLLVGAGEMAQAAARKAIDMGVRRVIVANRTLARAEELARDLAESAAGDTGSDSVTCPAVLAMSGGAAPEPPVRPAAGLSTRAVGMDALGEAIAEADLVICSTGSPEPVLDLPRLGGGLKRRGRLLFIVDIAVPRDVDPAIGGMSNVFLYNLNDLDRVVAQDMERRRQEIALVEVIVEDELGELVKWHDSLQVASIIRLLKRRFAQRQQTEIQRYGKRFSADSQTELGPFVDGLCSKLLHEPVMFLRQLSEEAGAGEQLMAMDVIRRMFKLDDIEAGQEDPS